MHNLNFFSLLIAMNMVISGLFSQPVEVRGITIEEKINGTLIRIKKTGLIDPSQISAWTSGAGWFYVTLVGARIDTSREWPFVPTGMVNKFQYQQLSELVQLNFKLNRNIETFEIDATDSDGDIVITLRLPLSESLAAVDKMKSRKGREFSVGGDKDRIGKYFLMVAGAGLVARGLLRSDGTEFFFGGAMLVGGYLLYEKEHLTNAEIEPSFAHVP